MPFWMATLTYCNWPASKQPSWPAPSATTLSSAFYPQAPHRSGRQVTSLRSPTLTSASLELQTQSSCLLLLSQSLLLSCLLSDGPFTLHVGNHKGNAVSSIPFTVQHTKDWLIFNTLDAEAAGISFNFLSLLACFQQKFTWPSEDSTSQNTRMYHAAQTMKKSPFDNHPLLATQLAIHLITQHTHRGMQETTLLIPAGSALRWTARQHDSAPHSYQGQLTDHSSWQRMEYEENDMRTTKAKQSTKRSKDLRCSEKKSVKSFDSSTTTIKQNEEQLLPTMSYTRRAPNEKRDRESCQRRVLNQHLNQHRKENNLQSLQWNEKLPTHVGQVPANSYFKAKEEQWP